MTRIVLAYPDTAWGQDPHRLAPDPLGFDEAIAWLGEQHHGAEVIALMLDFGHSNVELRPKPILQTSQHHSLVFQRMCVRNVDIKG